MDQSSGRNRPTDPVNRTIKCSIASVLFSMAYTAAYLACGSVLAEIAILPDILGLAAIFLGFAAIGWAFRSLASKPTQVQPVLRAKVAALAVTVCVVGAAAYFGTTPLSDWIFMRSSGIRVRSWAQSVMLREDWRLSEDKPEVPLWSIFDSDGQKDIVHLPDFVAALKPEDVIMTSRRDETRAHLGEPTIVIDGGSGFGHYRLEVRLRDDPSELEGVAYSRRIAPEIYLHRTQ
jgi:hypothetical protein